MKVIIDIPLAIGTKGVKAIEILDDFVASGDGKTKEQYAKMIVTDHVVAFLEQKINEYNVRLAGEKKRYGTKDYNK